MFYSYVNAQQVATINIYLNMNWCIGIFDVSEESEFGLHISTST